MLKGMLGWFGSYFDSKQRKGIAALLFLSVLLLLVHCAAKVKHHSSLGPPILYQGSHLVIPENSALRSVIHVAPVQVKPVITTVVVPATIQAIPAKTAAILPPVTGQITKIYKILGESVTVGEPLYALTSPDLAQAIAAKISAEAVYTLAQKNLQRQRELAQFEINSLRDMEQAESDVRQAEAAYQSTVARLQALHLDPNAPDPSGHLILRSPINGFVTAVSAGVGSYWSDVTSPIMTVSDLSKVYSVASAQEHDLSDFFLGQEAEVVFEQSPKTYTSPVEFIDPILNADTRTINVGISLDNPDHHLLPNMFVRMKFKRKPRERILLPMTAVVQRGFDSIVFVEVAPWEFEPRVVNVGLQVDDKIVIESGLKDQERVAMTGSIILND